ncbi:uncharacterized protein LOC143607281 [Bidens hawaiensis]|uniref:uncharacterized protein LOC143607281 n=1 Tax=Bidens hawaiensis TaxID=980011 RepID=UPI00404A11FE
MRAALKDKGLRISRSKTEYLHCDFSGAGDARDSQITIRDQVVPQATKFKYLGSYVQRNGEIDNDVTHRIQAGWCWWRAATGVLSDRRLLGHQENTSKQDGGGGDEVAEVDVWAYKGRLRWYGHVKRRQETMPVRAVETLNVEGRRSRGRPKLTWVERIMPDLLELHLSEDMVYDKCSWRRRLKVKDF